MHASVSISTPSGSSYVQQVVVDSTVDFAPTDDAVRIELITALLAIPLGGMTGDVCFSLHRELRWVAWVSTH